MFFSGSKEKFFGPPIYGQLIRINMMLNYSLDHLDNVKSKKLKYGKFELMKILQIEIPDDLNLVEFDHKMSMASKLYDLGKISLGQGAKIVGLSKKVFMELLGEFGVSVFGYTEDELENDLNNV